MACGARSPLSQLADLLTRFDDLSNILVWTTKKVRFGAARPCRLAPAAPALTWLRA